MILSPEPVPGPMGVVRTADRGEKGLALRCHRPALALLAALPMKALVSIAFTLAALNASANESFQAAVPATPPTHPGLYSFADVYRLTVSGGVAGTQVPLAPSDSAVRVAAAGSAAAPELQYTVVRMVEPGRWMLLLAGLAAALWVARRRLGYFF